MTPEESEDSSKQGQPTLGNALRTGIGIVSATCTTRARYMQERII
jgi:hypothetical protein